MDYSKVRNAAQRSNKRLKVGGIDSEDRAEAAEMRRRRKAHAAYMRRVQQEEEDRNRYIIPEFQDLEELLAG